MRADNAPSRTRIRRPSPKPWPGAVQRRWFDETPLMSIRDATRAPNRDKLIGGARKVALARFKKGLK